MDARVEAARTTCLGGGLESCVGAAGLPVLRRSAAAGRRKEVRIGERQVAG